MSEQKFQKNLRWMLLFGFVFMLGEAVFHFSGIRLWSISSIWPNSAMSYATFFQHLWASASLLIAGAIYVLYKEKDIRKKLMYPLSFYCIFHGLLLIWWGSTAVVSTWQYPSLHVWNPWYEVQLFIEGSVLLIFAGYILYGRKKKYL
jgi:hypothetical protein